MRKGKVFRYCSMAVVLGIAIFFADTGKGRSAYKKGMDFFDKGEYEKALSPFQEAIREEKSNPRYYIGYGMSLNHLNQFTEAKKEFQGALQCNGDLSKENQKQIYYGMAVAEYGLGSYQDVISHCERALAFSALSNKDNDILFTKAVAEQLSGKLQEAKKDYEKILSNSDLYLDAYMQLGKIAEEEGDYNEAAKQYEAATRVDESFDEAYFCLSQAYQMAGREAEAEKPLNQLIGIQSNNAEDFLTIGKAFYYKKDYNSAKDYLQRAYDGKKAEGKYYLALIYMKQGDYNSAVTELNTYILENTEDLNVEAYNQLAGCYMHLKEYAKAQNAITKGLSFGNTSAVRNLKRNQVVLLEKQNQYKLAKAAAKNYIEVYGGADGMEKELEFIKTKLK